MSGLFRKIDHGLQCGDEVFAGGTWWPVNGYALTAHPNGDTTGSVFTLKPRGKYEPWLGYRIDMSEVTDCRRPTQGGLDQ